MVDAALRNTMLSEQEQHAIPDVPIESSVHYHSRVKGASRHFDFFPFFAKKPWPVVQEYIKHYSRPGDLVCDPFAGSGVAPVEALVLGRRAIASDINPVARFITRMTAIAPVDLEALQAAFDQVEIDVRAQIERLDGLSQSALAEILATLDFPRVPIPQTVRRAGIDTVDQLHTSRQLAGLTLLRDAINRVADPLMRALLKVALANTVRYCNIMYLLPYDKRGERRSPYRGNAGFLRRFSYSPASPKQFIENQVWPTFHRTFQAVLEAKNETNLLINGHYSDKTFIVANVPAARIHEVTGEAQVDYFFTDPPYSNDIHFLDLSTLWAAWLNLEITDDDRKSELLLRSTNRQSRELFARQFADAAESISRALRQDRWLTLVYKHKDLSLWQAIVEACEDSGLRFVNSVWQDVKIRSTRQVESPDVNPQGDMYLNFRKMLKPRFEQIYGQPAPIQIPTRSNYVEHEIERLIVAYLGADIELLTAGVLQQVLNSRIIGDRQNPLSGINSDIGKVLGDGRFARWQQDGGKPLWILNSPVHLDRSLGFTDRARYYVFDFLREHGEATEGELRKHLLSRMAEDRDNQQTQADVPALLRNIGEEIAPHRWRLDVEQLHGYKQLRLLFEPSQADELRQQVERRLLGSEIRPLRVDLEGIALLRNRLRDANKSNAKFNSQQKRLFDVLQALVRRIETEFGDQVESVIAVGDWARYGIDLRNLPFEDVVVLIVTRRSERPFSFYLQIAERVFANLGDEDIIVQFRLETLDEWRTGEETARGKGLGEALGIPILARA